METQLHYLQRLCEITELLSNAKRVLDKTGNAPLPFDVYNALIEERRNIREMLATEQASQNTNDQVSE